MDPAEELPLVVWAKRRGQSDPEQAVKAAIAGQANRPRAQTT